MKEEGHLTAGKLWGVLALLIAVMVFFAVIRMVNAAPNGNARVIQASASELGPQENWVGSWTASQKAPYSRGISHRGFQNETIRMVIHPHLGGKALRIRLSNVFGTRPLTFADVHVAVSGKKARIITNTDHRITFEEKSSVTIPVGSKVLSDPIAFDVKNGQNLSVSLYVPGKSGPTTWHSLSNQTTYVSSGDHTADVRGLSFKKKMNSWFWLSAVDVVADSSVKGAVVALGDSLTDGLHSTMNANHRRSDFLANRFSEKPLGQRMSVLNEGISGNRILHDSPVFGESALHRLNRDVLSQAGVTDVILLEGINDIGQTPHVFDADKIISGMKQIITRVHAQGLDIYGGTLLPFEGARSYTARGEKTREAINHWIRTGGAFDGIIDYDKVVRDPNHPLRLWPKYDSGDHLHPNDSGYKAMAEAVNLSMLIK